MIIRSQYLLQSSFRKEGVQQIIFKVTKYSTFF